MEPLETGDIYFGLGGNDTIASGDGDDTLFGQAGNDRLDGGTGFDRLVGGRGNDFYVYDFRDTFEEKAGEGIDTIVSNSNESHALEPNVENLRLTGTSASNGTGNASANIITGNAGLNTLNGSTGNDKLIGAAGDDRLIGGVGDDRLEGGAGNDRLLGGAGSDVMLGGTGHDSLDGSLGSDRMEGGAGNDTFIVNSVNDFLVEAAGAGIDTVRSSIAHTLKANVENLTLTGTAVLNGNGNASDNSITGNSGPNTLNGLSGNDKLIGGGGDDRLLGGTGNDRLSGGTGNDRLSGETGHDSLLGGAGNDSLGGGTGTDRLEGGDGDDLLRGGADVDELAGGSGADTFRFAGVAEVSSVLTNTVRGAVAGDAIDDFASGIDRLELAVAFDVAGALAGGSLVEGASFSTILDPYDGTNAGANTNHDAGVGSFVFSTADATLYYDPDGNDPGYRVVATLTDGTQAIATDIVIA